MLLCVIYCDDGMGVINRIRKIRRIVFIWQCMGYLGLDKLVVLGLYMVSLRVRIRMS